METERDHQPKKRKMWTLERENNKSWVHWSNFNSKRAFDYLYAVRFSTIIKTINNIQEEKQNFSSKKVFFFLREKNVLNILEMQATVWPK